MRKLAVRALLAILLAPALASCAAMGDVTQATMIGANSPKMGAGWLVSRRFNAQWHCRDCLRRCTRIKTQIDIAKCRYACRESYVCRHGEGPI